MDRGQAVGYFPIMGCFESVCSRDVTMKAIRTPALVLLLALAVATVSSAQPVSERFVGTVQWIAGERMALALDSGSSVPIDLTSADQGDYQTLAPGDRVVVTGTLSPERDRVIATSIAPVSN